MSEKLSKHQMGELKEMVSKRDPEQPVEKVLAVFCQRHSLNMERCRYYYNKLVESGEIKE